MKFLLLRLASLLLIVLASGCANIAEQKQHLSSKQESVTTYGDMEFELLALDRPRAISLDGESPTFFFAEGRSYFAATQLPPATQQRFVTFQSEMNGSLLNRANILIPRFAFLDSSKHLLGTETASEIRRTTDFFRGTSFEGRVAVPRSAEYLVVYASDKTEHSLFVFSQNGTRWPVALTPAGKTIISMTTQAVATIADSGFSESGAKAQLFMVTEIDGRSIPNANTESSKASVGTGFRLTTVLTSREVPVKTMKLKLVGTHITGAPIHALFNMASGSFFSVTGTVDFTPTAGAKYIVKGELKKEGSSIWIEDTATGRQVTEKIVAQ